MMWDRDKLSSAPEWSRQVIEQHTQNSFVLSTFVLICLWLAISIGLLLCMRREFANPRSRIPAFLMWLGGIGIIALKVIPLGNDFLIYILLFNVSTIVLSLGLVMFPDWEPNNSSASQVTTRLNLFRMFGLALRVAHGLVALVFLLAAGLFAVTVMPPRIRMVGIWFFPGLLSVFAAIVYISLRASSSNLSQR